MKKIKFLSILLLAVFTLPILTSCGSDDDENTINEYVGVWKCTIPATYVKSTLVTKGTTLHITSSGNMTWTISTGKRYDATMKALGDGWVDITYNGKTYNRAEMYVRNNSLTINVNGNANLKVKDFPFDGVYEKSN
jgi:hypothetical protein